MKVLNAIEVIMGWLRTFSGLLILILMFLTCLQITLRLIQGNGLPGVLEISEVLLVIVVYLALGGAEISRVHIRSSVLTGRLSYRARAVVLVCGTVLSIAVVLWMAWVTGVVAVNSVLTGEYRFGIVRMPVWPARIAIPLGLVMLAAAVAVTTIASLKKLLGPAEVVVVGDDRA